MRLWNSNTAVCLLWSLRLHNFHCTFILKIIQLHPVQRIYRNLNLQIFNKRCRSCGNCITGNVDRVLRNMKSDALLMSRFSAQEHDTGRRVPVSALLSFTKYICVYLYTTYHSPHCSIIQCYVLSVIVNQNNKTTRCIKRNCLQLWKLFNPYPANVEKMVSS